MGGVAPDRGAHQRSKLAMFPPEQPPIPGYEPVRFLYINFGTVYLAREASSGSLVILKVFPRELAASDTPH